jgi:hypothetical protein
MPDDFNRVMGSAANVVEKLKKDIQLGLVNWTEFPTPSKGMRAFQGKTASYTLLVTEANIIDGGVQIGIKQHGMLTTTTGMVIMLPPEVATLAYKNASRQRN